MSDYSVYFNGSISVSILMGFIVHLVILFNHSQFLCWLWLKVRVWNPCCSKGRINYALKSNWSRTFVGVFWIQLLGSLESYQTRKNLFYQQFRVEKEAVTYTMEARIREAKRPFTCSPYTNSCTAEGLGLVRVTMVTGSIVAALGLYLNFLNRRMETRKNMLTIVFGWH